ERGEGADDSVVRGWLTRALSASRGEQWVCDKCHNIMAEWSPVCDSCNGFDTLTWREPLEKAVPPTATGAEMLPLLVGTPKIPVPAADTVAPDVVPGPSAPKPAEPRVAPGMVPRESDYEDVEPATTITTPEPVTAPEPEPAPMPDPAPE